MKPFFFQEHCSSPKSSCVKVYFRSSAHFHEFYILWQNPSKQINSYLRCPGLTSLMSRNDASKKISKFLAANYFPGGSGDHVTFSMLVQGSQKCPREYLLRMIMKKWVKTTITPSWEMDLYMIPSWEKSPKTLRRASEASHENLVFSPCRILSELQTFKKSIILTCSWKQASWHGWAFHIKLSSPWW